MKSLSELSKNYPLTDKGPYKACGSKGHNYTKIYDEHFKKFKNKKIKFLEIGFGGGDSLNMFNEYFEDIEIYCLDNNLSRIEEYGYQHKPNIHILYADQSNRESLVNACDKIGEKFDIIIDDGSHIVDHIKTTFYALYEDYLNEGGIYFIEDSPEIIDLGKEINYDKSENSESYLINIKK